jgi:hypothetical protein
MVVNITKDDRQFVAMKRAAYELGIHYWKLQRAVKQGLVPSYAPFNSRRLVRISDLLSYIESTKSGGAQ